jgi:hypothetical protein
MRKTLKTLRLILLSSLGLIVLTLLAVNLFADRAVKAGIEASATKKLSVAVNVSDVDLSMIAGKIALQNLSISNPPGYQNDRLLELKNADIEVDVKSLLGDVVNIRDIRLDGVDVILEQRGVSGNNLQDVLQAISGSSKEERGKKLHVDNLEISNITVRIKLLPVPSQGDTITLELTPIRMTDLGRDNKLDVAALSGRVVLAIANRLVEQGGGVLPSNMVETITSTLGKTIDLSTRIIETTEDIGKEITEGLKKLLKPQKEE